jgi:hypothetical protein
MASVLPRFAAALETELLSEYTDRRPGWEAIARPGSPVAAEVAVLWTFWLKLLRRRKLESWTWENDDALSPTWMRAGLRDATGRWATSWQ